MFNANAKEKHKQKDSRIFCQLRKHTTHTDRTQNTHTHTRFETKIADVVNDSRSFCT